MVELEKQWCFGIILNVGARILFAKFACAAISMCSAQIEFSCCCSVGRCQTMTRRARQGKAETAKAMTGRSVEWGEIMACEQAATAYTVA